MSKIVATLIAGLFAVSAFAADAPKPAAADAKPAVTAEAPAKVEAVATPKAEAKTAAKAEKKTHRTHKPKAAPVAAKTETAAPAAAK